MTPLTALKFAELSVKAGFPPGVINILPGPGSSIGQALTEHPDIRKIGFTGSTPIGKTLMERYDWDGSYRYNVKMTLILLFLQ